MLNLREILLRADEITIQEILGEQTVKILNLLHNEQPELVSLKSIDFNKINQKLLQRPPVITYENRLIHVDLSAIEIVKKIPVDNIKSFVMEDGKIVVSVGI